MSEHHHVLVIHGTWNPPSAERPEWHQLDEANPTNFCRALNDCLEQRGLGRPVWRPCAGAPTGFAWTGRNKHEDRLEAGQRLAHELVMLTRADPSARIDLVAHSHGCNVVLKAVERYLGMLREEASALARNAERAFRDGSPEEAVMAAVQEVFGEHARQVGAERPATLAMLRDALARAQDGAQRPVRSGVPLVDDAIERLNRAFPEIAARRRRRAAEHVRSRPFEEAWVASAESNRLGRLVLLGPPVFYKRWRRTAAWSLRSLLGRAVDLVLSVVGGAAAGYLYVQFLWAMLWVYSFPVDWLFGTGTFPTPRLDPLAWPRWVAVVSAAFGVAVALALFVETVSVRRRNVNLYFDERGLPTPSGDGTTLPLEALVVHAGLLDEVFFGFSSEPIVYGALVPQVRTWLYPSLRWTPPHARLGDVTGLPHAWAARHLVAGIRFLRALGMLLVRPLVLWVEPRLTARLLNLVSAPAYGLLAEEFAEALIEPRNRLELPAFFRETAWDVAQLLVTAAPVRPATPGDRRARYAFLWDDAALEARKTDSGLWQQINGIADTVRRRYRRYPEIDTGRVMTELARTSVALEERFKEIAGVVQLAHSSYYTNTTIIDGIARFLATGSRE